MIEIKGNNGIAKVFTDNIEPEAIQDIRNILSSPVAIGANMRIMPDVHKGMSFPIGTTMKITDKVIPNGVSVDIGCGMLVQMIKESDVDLAKLDKVIHKNVPSGFNIHTKAHRFANLSRLYELRFQDSIKNFNKIPLAIGSLGGGNHFIELNKDETGQLFLVIHTGSRNLGKQIADYYQNAAYEYHVEQNNITKGEVIAQLCYLGKEERIERTLKNLNLPKIDKDMAYCEGQLMEDYLHDMAIAQEYASLNRKAIADIIQCGMRWTVESEFETIHNYIDMETKILRKGAVRADKGEMLVIPINMRDGVLICVGKGNEDYNNSAPHGAGRIMSRKKAKETFTMEEFQNTMGGVYTTCITKDTLDESPMSYKPMQEIIDNIGDTVDIVNIIKPIYNFKAGGE